MALRNSKKKYKKDIQNRSSRKRIQINSHLNENDNFKNKKEIKKTQDNHYIMTYKDDDGKILQQYLYHLDENNNKIKDIISCKDLEHTYPLN